MTPLRTPVPPFSRWLARYSERTAEADGCQTREIPTNGVVEGCGDPPAGSRETANASRPRTPSISCGRLPTWPAGSTPGRDRGDAAVGDEPELVGPVRSRRRCVGQHDDAGVLGVGDDHGHPAATGELTAAQRRVRCGQHRLDPVGPLLGERDRGPLVVEPLLLHRVGRRGRADAEHADDGGRGGEPAPPRHRRRATAPVTARGTLRGGGRAGEDRARASAAAAPTRSPRRAASPSRGTRRPRARRSRTRRGAGRTRRARGRPPRRARTRPRGRGCPGSSWGHLDAQAVAQADQAVAHAGLDGGQGGVEQGRHLPVGVAAVVGERDRLPLQRR